MAGPTGSSWGSGMFWGWPGLWFPPFLLWHGAEVMGIWLCSAKKAPCCRSANHISLCLQGEDLGQAKSPQAGSPLHLQPSQQRSPWALAQHCSPRAASQLRVLGASPRRGGFEVMLRPHRSLKPPRIRL